MNTLLSFFAAPLTLAAGVAAAVYLKQMRLALILGAIALALFFAGRLISYGSQAAIQKIERQNHEAVEKGRTGADRARACHARGGLWEPATRECLGAGAGD